MHCVMHKCIMVKLGGNLKQAGKCIIASERMDAPEYTDLLIDQWHMENLMKAGLCASLLFLSESDWHRWLMTGTDD